VNTTIRVVCTPPKCRVVATESHHPGQIKSQQRKDAIELVQIDHAVPIDFSRADFNDSAEFRCVP